MEWPNVKDLAQYAGSKVMKQKVAVGFVLLATAVAVSALPRQSLPGHRPPAALSAPVMGRLAAEVQLDLAVGLPLRNREALTNLLQALYDPASPQYRRFLTPAEFTARFGPSQEAYDAVIGFARSNRLDITGTHPNRLLVNVRGAARDIERTFQINLQLHQHPREPRAFFAPDAEPTVEPGLPVLAVSGLSNYRLPRPAGLRQVDPGSGGVTPLGGSGPGGAYFGGDFRAAYVPGANLTGAGQAVGLLQFDGFYPADIQQYKTLAGLPDIPVTTVYLEGFDGTPGPSNSEVALDIELAMAMAPGLSRVILYAVPMSGNPNTALNRMATDNWARQLSASWSYPVDAITDQIFLEFAAQGQSFFNASGDDGAFVGPIDPPSDNPFITIVGGTTLSTTGPGGDRTAETAWNWNSTGHGTSATGGGISTDHPLPSWQQGAATEANQGSATMRNIPDVAMVGDNVWVIYDNGRKGVFGGTSLASPLWAAFTALANEQAESYGQPPVGFLNPAMYALGASSNYLACFYDVTTGNNTNPISPQKFYAVSGYDLCTGWGTPAGSNLINALAPPVPVTKVILKGYELTSESCTPNNRVIDPGESVRVWFELENSGPLPATNLVVTLLSSEGVLPVSEPQNYGLLSKGGKSRSLPFVFAVSGSCGARVEARLQIQDGSRDLGVLTNSFLIGNAITPLAESFDAAVPPALPQGWSASIVGGVSNWVTSTLTMDSAPNSAYGGEAEVPGITQLVSPVFIVNTTNAQLAFRQRYFLEADPELPITGYDGGVLELKVGSSGFVDILDAGGRFEAGGYTRVIDATGDNPLAGRHSWSGHSGGFVTTIVRLPASVAGQAAQFRWRLATDTYNGYGGTGWYLDSIAVTEGYDCCSGGAIVAPQIISEPVPSAVPVGGEAAFAVLVAGTEPLAYQWTFNGVKLIGATENPLILTNVQAGQWGDYAVKVSNLAGSAVSAPAPLKVLVPPELFFAGFGGSGTNFTISLDSVVGLTYTLEFTDSLTNPSWTPVQPGIAGTGSVILLEDTTGSPPGGRFYRVNCW
jgi:hypothetical protein